jgi:hypothetical protein
VRATRTVLPKPNGPDAPISRDPSTTPWCPHPQREATPRNLGAVTRSTVDTEMPLDKPAPIRRPRNEKAPDAAKRTEATRQSTTPGDGTPLSPPLVKLIRLLARAAARDAFKNGAGS